MQYTVKKPINNNILRVVDPTGCELIVTGRGLGFGVKPGYKIEAETVERSYRMTSPAVQQKLVELLEQIPYEHLLLTDELVAMIRSRVNYPLNESLLITLADHISFAIQRSEQGIRFSNPLMAPIREFYPEEYRLGMECLAAIRQRCHADLSDDEGGFIALHIVNAELNTTMSVVNDVTRFVDGCVQVVEYFYNCHFDRDALDFSRFTVHLRFFCATRISRKTGAGKRYPRRSVPRPDRPQLQRTLQMRLLHCGVCPQHLAQGAFGRGTGVPYDPSETDSDGKISSFASLLILHRSFLCGYICWIRT